MKTLAVTLHQGSTHTALQATVDLNPDMTLRDMVDSAACVLYRNHANDPRATIVDREQVHRSSAEIVTFGHASTGTYGSIWRLSYALSA